MVTSANSMPQPSDAEKNYEASHNYQGFLIAELREIFAAVTNPTDWEKRVGKQNPQGRC